MEKKNVRAVTVVVFASVITVIAVTGGMTESDEMGQMQDAMRRLKRADHLQYTYTSTFSGEDGITSERVDVWADQISGCWAAEYYTTDEDGTRPGLRQYCDGREVYRFIDWNGDWETVDGAAREAPYLETVTVMPYSSGDISDVQNEEKEGMQKISFGFTQEYLDVLSEENEDMLEKEYRAYQRSGVSEEALKFAEVTMEQYRKRRQEGVSMAYTIDSDAVLRVWECTIEASQPAVTQDKEGNALLGTEQKMKLQMKVSINRYNEEGILNKIEQCRQEVSYQQ